MRKLMLMLVLLSTIPVVQASDTMECINSSPWTQMARDRLALSALHNSTGNTQAEKQNTHIYNQLENRIRKHCSIPPGTPVILPIANIPHDGVFSASERMLQPIVE